VLRESVSSQLDDALTAERAYDWSVALQAYSQLRSTPDRVDRCRALIGLARCLLQTRNRGETDEAGEALEEARALASEIGDPSLEGQQLLQWGHIQEHQGYLQRALERYIEALTVLPRTATGDYVEASLTLASALRRRGELGLAKTRLDGVEDLVSTLDPRLSVLYQEELAAVHMARGEYRQAIRGLHKALALDETIAGGATARGRLLLAESLRLVGDLPESHKLIDEALSLYKAREATMGLSEVYAQLGLWHEDNESYAPAIHAFQESLKHDELSDDRVGQARAKRHMARVLRKSGDSPRARELLVEARDVLFREDHVELAHLWQEEAELALTGDTPNYQDAIALFKRALEVTVEDGDERAIAVAKRHLARAYREDDDLVQAEALLRDAIPPIQDREDLRELDELLDDLGEVLLEQDRYAEAGEVLAESLALDEKLGRVGSKARSLLLLGQVAHETGNHDSALRYLEQAVAVYEDAKQDVGLSEALQHLAAWHLDRGQTTRAVRLLRRGLEIDSRLDDPLGRTRARRLLAAAYRQRGDLERADEYLDEARRDLAPIDDPVERALVECENAYIDLARGAADPAGKHALRAQALFEEVGHRPVDVATCERLRAMSAAHCGRYKEALEMLGRARTVFEERGDMPELDELHDDLAEVWLMQGRLDLARTSAKDSLAVGASPGGWAFGRGRSLLLLAQISMDEGREGQTASREYIDEALKLYDTQENEAGQCRAYLARGDWHVTEGDLNGAMTQYKKARARAHRLRDLHRAATCHRKLAGIHLQRHEIQRAEDALRDASESLEGIADPRARAPLDLEWGRLLLAKGEHTDAITSLRRAVTAFRELRVDQEWRTALRLLSTCLHADGQTSAALESMREMEQESASMYNVLLSDMHPRVADASRPSFASGNFKDAVNNAFTAVELLIKECTAELANPPAWKDAFSKHVRLLMAQDDSWGDGISSKNRGTETFQHFITGSREFFYNPAKHDNVHFSAVSAFAAIATANVIAETVEQRDLPWLVQPEPVSTLAVED
jgi:tetratricopeptide (TPR) repeat protein